MNKKKLYTISLAVFTVAAATLLFLWAFGMSAKSKARPKLYDEITTFEESTEQVKAENEEIEKQIEDIDTELSTKDTVNNYYMEYRKSHDDLSVEISDLKQRVKDLDSAIAEKQSELNGTEGLSQGKKGKTYTLTSAETYTCPDKIPQGRYTAKGSGTFTVMTSQGKARVSQNLDVAYDHSHTFNLSNGERIKVTGSVTLTEIK